MTINGNKFKFTRECFVNNWRDCQSQNFNFKEINLKRKEIYETK